MNWQSQEGTSVSGVPCVGPVELVGNSFFELSIKSIRSFFAFVKADFYDHAILHDIL